LEKKEDSFQFYWGKNNNGIIIGKIANIIPCDKTNNMINPMFNIISTKYSK
jgi:hypothetical protein